MCLVVIAYYCLVGLLWVCVLVSEVWFVVPVVCCLIPVHWVCMVVYVVCFVIAYLVLLCFNSVDLLLYIVIVVWVCLLCGLRD